MKDQGGADAAGSEPQRCRATPASWTVVDRTTSGRGAPSYTEIRGPNDEAICTIFPAAGNGGVGIVDPRENAAMIVALANGDRP